MKKVLFGLSRIVLIILITLLYVVIFFSYNDVFGLSLSSNGNIAVGIDLSDEKTVIVYDSDLKKINEINLSFMGKYKFDINNDKLIVYSGRSDCVFTYDLMGNILSEKDMSNDEYKAIENNPMSIKSDNGDVYSIKNSFGVTDVVCIRDGVETVLYTSDANDVAFRAAFTGTCYLITVILCIYLFRMFKGKYDDFDR